MNHKLAIREKRKYQLFEENTEEHLEFTEHCERLYFDISDMLELYYAKGIPDFMTLMHDNESERPEFNYFARKFVRIEFPELEGLEIEDFISDHFYTLDVYYINDVIKVWKELGYFYIDQTQTNPIINQPFTGVW